MFSAVRIKRRFLKRFDSQQKTHFGLTNDRSDTMCTMIMCILGSGRYVTGQEKVFTSLVISSGRWFWTMGNLFSFLVIFELNLRWQMMRNKLFNRKGGKWKFQFGRSLSLFLPFFCSRLTPQDELFVCFLLINERISPRRWSVEGRMRGLKGDLIHHTRQEANFFCSSSTRQVQTKSRTMK